MNYVYRYTDLADGIIKYVGISCRGSLEDGCLKRRFNEHCNTDWWMQGKTWMIEYIEVPTKNDAHALEGHFIAKYGTKQWYNFSKTSMGLLSFLNVELEWKLLESGLYVEPRDVSRPEEDKIYVNVMKFPDLVAEKLAEIQHCLKVVNSFLLAEDYSRFDKETLLADKKELEYREEVFISFQLGKKLYLC